MGLMFFLVWTVVWCRGCLCLISCGRKDLQTLYFVGGWRDTRRDWAGRKEDY